MTVIWPKGGKRQSKEQREEILRAYLISAEQGTRLAVSRGLSPMYAYKIAHERGLIPRERKYWSPNLREGGLAVGDREASHGA